MSKGNKFDEGKRRMELLPVRPLQRIAEVLTDGAKKYEDRNWEAGIEWSRCYGATLRHLLDWWNGADLDESGRTHLAHAAAEILFLLEFLETHPELDDRPNK